MKLDEGDWNPYTMEELDEMVRMKSEGYVVSLFPLLSLSSSPLHSSFFVLPTSLRLNSLFVLPRDIVMLTFPSNGTFLSGALYYMGAKKYAEKAAWAIQEESGTSWTLATINCVMILGPPSMLRSKVLSPLQRADPPHSLD